MKIKHLLIPLIIIAIIILWFLLKEKEQPPRPINVVTKKVEEPPKIAKTPIDPNKYIEELNKATDDRRAFLKEKQEREEPNLSYLQAYRDMKYYKYCNETFHALKNNQDIKNIPFSYSKKQIQATDVQMDYHINRINKCKTLIDLADEQYISGQTRLNERFRRIQPKSENEKNLSNSLQLVGDLNNSRFLLNRSLEGEPSDPVLIREYRKELSQLYRNYNKIRGTNSLFGTTYSDEQNELRTSIIQEIKNLIEAIKSNYVIDNKLIDVAKLDVLEKKNNLTNTIKTVISPDAFLVIMEEIMKEHDVNIPHKSLFSFTRMFDDNEYSNEKSLDEFDFIENIRSQLKLFDTEYYKFIMSATIELTLCSLGYECGESADYMVDICLLHADMTRHYNKEQNFSTSEEACGQSVVDYIVNTKLTTNQLLDSNNIMSMIVGHNE